MHKNLKLEKVIVFDILNFQTKYSQKIQCFLKLIIYNFKSEKKNIINKGNK